MMAAYAAACQGHHVTLLEQNEKLGKKLFITGKGRCNITNASDMDHLFANVMSNRKFLYSAFYTFDNEQVIAFFEEQGLRTKVERGNRVFPVSDHSSDVIAALSRALRAKHVEILLHTRVEKLLNGPDYGCNQHIKKGSAKQIAEAAACDCTACDKYRLRIRRNMFTFRQANGCFFNRAFVVTDIAHKLV